MKCMKFRIIENYREKQTTQEKNTVLGIMSSQFPGSGKF